MFVALDRVEQILNSYNISPVTANHNEQPNSERAPLTPDPLPMKTEIPDLMDNIVQISCPDTKEREEKESTKEEAKSVVPHTLLDESKVTIKGNETETKHDLCAKDPVIQHLDSTSTSEGRELSKTVCEEQPSIQGTSDVKISQGQMPTGNRVKKHGTKNNSKQNLIKGRHSCESCDLVFQSNSEYRKHYKQVHQVKGCPRCNKVFKGAAEMKMHLKEHKMQTKSNKSCDEYKCHMCNKKCDSLLSLKNHRQSMHESLVCTLCGKRYSEKFGLDRHMFEAHDYLEPGMDACNICKLTFRLKKRFIDHMELHKTGLKCNHCSEIFSDSKSLRCHREKEHTKRYCPHCPLTFKSDLEVKVRVTNLLDT